MSTTSRPALTTQQVEDGFAHEPEAEWRDPVNYGAHVSSNRRAFKRWLASVKAAEWDAGLEHALRAEGFNEVIFDRLKKRNPHRK